MSGWIRTFTGRKVEPLNLRVSDVDIRDIAHALSNQCRFTGHVREFYSVAQHSVQVSHLCPQNLKLCGLLHDASEAYLIDLARPVKHAPQMAFFREAEDCIQRVIASKFKIPYPFPQPVHLADNVALVTEARDFMGVTKKWAGMPDPEDIVYLALPPKEAEILFLQTFGALVTA